MIESIEYANNLERKLIMEFKEKFKQKIGYDPIVLTKVTVDEHGIPLMRLDQLESYFEPFLPIYLGKKLQLNSKCRKRNLVELRMMFFFIARNMKYTLVEIGQHLGGRDHTTVLHNLAMFRNLMEVSDTFRETYISILTHIKKNHESPDLDIFDQIQAQSEPALLS